MYCQSPLRRTHRKDRGDTPNFSYYCIFCGSHSPSITMVVWIRSDAYVNSLEIARSSRDLQQVLGRGIHFAGFPVGSALPGYQSDFAEWSISIAGSAGKGRLYGVANRVGNDWEYSRLAVVVGDSKIDLTPTPARMNLPSAGDKVVYLVPIDLSPKESLNWAPAYYKAKFGVDVRVLSPIAAMSTEYDQPDAN